MTSERWRHTSSCRAPSGLWVMAAQMRSDPHGALRRATPDLPGGVPRLVALKNMMFLQQDEDLKELLWGGGSEEGDHQEHPVSALFQDDFTVQLSGCWQETSAYEQEELVPNPLVEHTDTQMWAVKELYASDSWIGSGGVWRTCRKLDWRLKRTTRLLRSEE